MVNLGSAQMPMAEHRTLCDVDGLFRQVLAVVAFSFGGELAFYHFWANANALQAMLR
jgi:hypothetical protein